MADLPIDLIAMHQLTQNLKNGEMRVLDVPFPAVEEGTVLVRNHFSAISAGTEGRTVRDARKGYVAKARARQKEVRQVVASVRTLGLAATYDRVMRRLEAPSALGYSCAGEVMAVGRGVRGIEVGARVACAGGTAVHAEVVAVPQHLCVPVAEGVDLRHAAFTAVGAIALQGIRQADLGLGATCVVIGLGLVGALTLQLLEAAGVQAIGIDVDAGQVRLARQAGARWVLERSQAGLEETVRAATRGAGADAVVIAAGTASRDPIELSGRLCRQKGRVVIVGAVPTGFTREPFYRKELELRMSCSYGPGRYDPRYEEQGIDYPIGYVRWTEQRNMQAFVDLLAAGRLSLGALVTHTFPLERAAEAYDLILHRTEPFGGIVIAYDPSRPASGRVRVRTASPAAAGARIGFIGAGAFAQQVLLPAVRGQGRLVGVATARPQSARYVASRFGFAYCTGAAGDILSDPEIDTVFITTRHHLHAPYVLEALRSGKHVFVEKPLCLTVEELEEIRAVYEARGCHLMVGFNRRFAPHVRRIRSFLAANLPKAIHYRVNAGVLPPDHWIHDPAVGGGRILGEVCHFVDLAQYLAGAPVVQVSATALDDRSGRQDTVTVNLGFDDGSTASIAYVSNGSSRLAKEYLEVFCGGRVAVLDDFRKLTLYSDRVAKDRLRRQDKGHREEVARFLDAVRGGTAAPIPFDELYGSTWATLNILASLRERRTIHR